MPTRRRLWRWSVAALMTMGCQSDLQPQGPRELETDFDAAIGAAPDTSTPPEMVDSAPDASAGLVVEKCRPALGQLGPARAAIMVAGTGEAPVQAGPEQLTVQKLYESFDSLCSTCHGNPDAQMGALLVTSLETFKTQVGADSLERIKSENRSLVMPKDRKLLSEREAANPNDGVVLFAKRLEAWLAASKADSFADPLAAPVMPTDAAATVVSGAPFAVSKSLGSALSNMGSCTPAKELVGSATEPMDALDALFASMTKLEDLPPKLSQTDLFTLDSEQLAKQGVLSFAPAYTLWADDAHKMRYVRVPRGQSIKYSIGTQSFEIPENTRFYKTFLKEVKDANGTLGYRKMETRIIVARNSVETQGAALPEIKAIFGTYAWNEDETEALLVTEPYKDGTPFADVITEYVTDEELDARLQAQITSGESPYLDVFKEGSRRHYAIPGADRCIQCHVGQSSFVLGFLPLQIMRRPVGQGGVIEPAEPDELNQLERFIDYGLITGLTKEEIPRKLLPLEKSQGARSPRTEYELVAQGYMLGNCAHCHNPKGYPSRTAPVLKDVLNFMPSASGGGIFEFPLDKFSPRTRRTLALSNQSEDKALFDVPYITPSLYEMGTGTLSPYAWNQLCAPEGGNCKDPPTVGPWRSLIYRNVDNGFTYSDDSTIYPHMPMNTAGFDCRVPKIMAEWMLSIPSIDVDADSRAIYLDTDTRSQPFIEVPRGHPRYDEAQLRATVRLSLYRDDPRAKACKNSPDTIDKNAASLDPKKWERSVLNANSPDFEYRIPDRTHWVKLDNRAPQGPWAPRNGQWEALFIRNDFSSYPESEEAKENGQSQEQLVQLLKQIHLDADFRKFALTDVPFGYWKEKPECDLSGVPKRGSIEPDPAWSWLDSEVQKRLPADKPVYMQAPGAAIFGMVCVNCHGAAFDANGRQATTVSDVTGGRVSVANFRDGMFGPVTSPGELRRNVFSGFATATDTVDDWSARYMAWMALGGTRAAIPPAVLRVVGDNPVLDQRVQRGVAASANMLEVAKVVCGAVLPMGGDVVRFAGLRYSRENGDWDLWRRVCSFRNPAPLRVYYRTAENLLKLDEEKQRSKEQAPAALFRRDIAEELASAKFYDAYDATTKVGLGLDVRDPECVAPQAPGDPEALRKFEEAYRAAAGNVTLRPLCPDSLGLTGSLAGRSMTLMEQNLWTLRGAANAGFSVFSYIDAVTRGEVKPKPEYDQCEKLSVATQP